MTDITFETLPSAVSILLEKVEKIENSLAGMNNRQQEPDRWMNIDELSGYHPDKPAKKGPPANFRGRLPKDFT